MFRIVVWRVRRVVRMREGVEKGSIRGVVRRGIVSYFVVSVGVELG